MTGKELQAYFDGQLAGDVPFTLRYHQWFKQKQLFKSLADPLINDHARYVFTNNPPRNKRQSHYAFLYFLLHLQRCRTSRESVQSKSQHNAHRYYKLLQSANRDGVVTRHKEAGICAVLHYVRLHGSPAGKSYATPHRDLTATIQQSEYLIRLTLWVGLALEEQHYVASTLRAIFTE